MHWLWGKYINGIFDVNVDDSLGWGNGKCVGSGVDKKIVMN